MSRVTAKRLACGVMFFWALNSGGSLHAQLGIGTWVQQSSGSSPGALTMTVEACCNGGYRLIYRIAGSAEALLTVESPFDGRDVPVLAAGKPTGETMGIKRLDAHHTFTVLKMNGKPFGTSKATLSADGKTLTVENEIGSALPGKTVGKQTETWLRK